MSKQLQHMTPVHIIVLLETNISIKCIIIIIIIVS